MEILSKRKMYEDIKSLNRELVEYRSQLEVSEERESKYANELENVYNTLKSIRELTDDNATKLLCISKMQDIKNMPNVYVED